MRAEEAARPGGLSVRVSVGVEVDVSVGVAVGLAAVAQVDHVGARGDAGVEDVCDPRRDLGLRRGYSVETRRGDDTGTSVEVAATTREFGLVPEERQRRVVLQDDGKRRLAGRRREINRGTPAPRRFHEAFAAG